MASLTSPPAKICLRPALLPELYMKPWRPPVWSLPATVLTPLGPYRVGRVDLVSLLVLSVDSRAVKVRQ